ncbi:MAG: LamG-like jellyroll fold domain-containing protein [Planctomycetota bacterium]
MRNQVIVLAVLLLGTWCGVTAGEENRLANPSFEQGKVGEVPPGWGYQTYDGKSSSKEFPPSVRGGGRDRRKCAVVDVPDGSRWSVIEQTVMLKPDVSKEMKLSAWMRSDDPEGRVELVILANAPKRKAYDIGVVRVPFKVTSSWQEYEVWLPMEEITDLKKDDELVVRAIVQVYAPHKRVYVDDVSFNVVGAGEGVLRVKKGRHVALDCPDLVITGSPITLQARFRTMEPAGIILECGAQNRDPGPQAGYALYMKWGGVRFGVNNAVEWYQPSLWDDVVTERRYDDGKWHHATGVIYGDGSTRVKLYVDGVEATQVKRQGQAQPALSVYTLTSPVARIGLYTDRITYPNPERFFWRCQLDEIRVWNRALSAKEIENNWDRSIDAGTPGLVAYWKFDEEDLAPGDTVHDAAGTNHGVMTEFTYVPAVSDPFFPLDRIAFPEADFDYWSYPARITGYDGQDRQRVGGVTWMKAQRRRVGERGNYKAGMTQCPDGRLVLATCWRHPEYDKDPQNQYYGIHIYESTDMGETWRKINETPLYGKELSISAFGEQGLFLIGQRADQRPGSIFDGMYAFRSTDGGRKWETVEVTEVDETMRNRYPYPRNVIVDRDGSLVYLRADGTDIALCRSSDGGKTWSFSVGKVDWDEDDMEPHGCFAEIGVLRTRDGRLLAVIRREIPRTNSEGLEDTFLAESTDDGKSWGRPWRASGTAEVHGYLTELADGRLVLTYASYHLPYGIFAIVSEDGGRTWDRDNPIRLAVSSNCFTGWPVTLALEDGSLLTSYAITLYGKEDEPRTATEVVRWRLP